MYLVLFNLHFKISLPVIFTILKGWLTIKKYQGKYKFHGFLIVIVALIIGDCVLLTSATFYYGRYINIQYSRVRCMSPEDKSHVILFEIIEVMTSWQGCGPLIGQNYKSCLTKENFCFLIYKSCWYLQINTMFYYTNIQMQANHLWNSIFKCVKLKYLTNIY